VQDTGRGLMTAHERANGATDGTGLARLRERLTALYGNASSLTLTAVADGGCAAMLVIPLSEEE
jgi:Putative regulator of cell autolysis